MPKWRLISEKVQFSLLVSLVIFIPLYPKFPLFNVPGTFVAIRLEDLLIAAALGFWLLKYLKRQPLKQLLSDRLVKLSLLFWGIGALSLFSGIFLTQTVTPHLGFLHYLRRIEFMVLALFAYSAVSNFRQFRSIFLALLFVVAVVNIYALGQQYLGWPVISTTNSEFSKGQILYLTPDARVNSSFAGHYDLAIFSVMVLCIFSAIVFVKGWAMRGTILTLSAVSFFVLVLTAARLAFAAFIVGVLASLVMSGKKIFIILIIGLSIIAAVYPSQLRDRLISTVTVNFLDEGDKYGGKHDSQSIRSKLNIPTLSYKSITSSNQLDEATLSGRFYDITPGEPTDTTQLGVYRSIRIRLDQEWPRALRALYKNPFLGTGYSSLGLASDNDYLRSLGEVGLLGTLSFGLIIFEFVKRIKRQLKNDNKFIKLVSAGVLAMMLGFLVNGLFFDVFESSKVAAMFWLILGVTLAADKLKDA